RTIVYCASLSHASDPYLARVPHTLSPRSSPRFPYTTLFRSRSAARGPAACPEAGGGAIHCNGCVCSAPVVSRVTPRARCRRTRRSAEHTSELQSRENIVCRLLLEKKK